MPRLFFGSSPAEGVMSTFAAPARKVVCARAALEIARVRLTATTAQLLFISRLPPALDDTLPASR